MFYPNTKFATALVAFSSNSSFFLACHSKFNILLCWLVGQSVNWSAGRLVGIQIEEKPIKVDLVDAQFKDALS